MSPVKKSAVEVLKSLEAKKAEAMSKLEQEYKAEQQKVIEEAKAELKAKLEDIRLMLIDYNSEADKLGLGTYTIGKTGTEGKAQAQPTGKRIRKSKEELQKLATDAISFLKLAGKQGMSTSELEAKVGFPLRPTPSEFIKKFAGVSVEHSGERRTRRYYHAK